MDSHSSKYIYDTLKGDIENNLYSFGSALPSERTLAEKYFVSRTTVRNAIEQLVHDGLLYKIQGKGTYVSMPKLHATNSVTSTRKYLKDHHLKPSTRIITSGIRNAGYKYSNIFNISESDQLFFVYRQRLGNKIPYSVEYTFLPFAYVPNAQSYNFAKESLYDCFNDNNIIVDHTVQTIDLVKIFKPQSDILQQPDGSASFKRVNTVYDIHNRVVEYTLSYSLADKFKFSQFFISVFFLFQLISRPIVEITKINADVNEIIPSVTTNMINVANGI